MSRLIRYILRRSIEIVPVVFAIIVISFTIVHLVPGDVAIVMAGESTDPDFIEAVREAYGLNKPLHEQFFIYFSKVVQGDLGYSYMRGRPVLDMITERMPATFLLILTSLSFAGVIGTLVGALSAKKLLSKRDTFVSTLSIVSHSIPSFWLGLMLIILFSLYLGWFPTSGFSTTDATLAGWDRIVDILRHLFLPALTLGIYFVGQYVRLARASVAEVIAEDYVTACRTIGYKENTIFIKHALRNALLPITTVMGLQLGIAVAGATLTETVFAWPGIGRLIYVAIISRDYPVILGSFIIIGIMVAISTVVVDIIYCLLDPRVEH